MAELVTALGIPALIAFFNNPVIAGVSLKEVSITSINIGYMAVLFYKKSKAITRLSELLFFTLHSKLPSSKERKEFMKYIKNIFKRYTRTEIIQIYKFYKSIKPVLILVDFNDDYFEKNKQDLIENPVKMKNYCLKKLYLRRLQQLILIKLYNATPKEDSIKDLMNDLINTFLDERISIDEVEKLSLAFENKINQQYEENKSQYDKDFIFEKNQLSKMIVEMSNNRDYTRGMRSNITELNNIIMDQENNVLEASKISLHLSKSLSVVEQVKDKPKEKQSLLDRLR